MGRMASATMVSAIQPAMRASAALAAPSPLTRIDVAKTATGAATMVMEFWVPKALPRDASGTRSSMKNPSKADAGPAAKPSSTEPCEHDRVGREQPDDRDAGAHADE